MAASNDPTVVRWRAFVYSLADRSEESLRLFARAAEIDPGNQENFFMWRGALKQLRRPAEAITVARAYNAHGPGVLTYGDIEFAYAGRIDRLREDLEQSSARMDNDARIILSFDVLRFERRFAELRTLLENSQAEFIRPGVVGEAPIPGIGKKPLAELRGWTALLMNDAEVAKTEGRKIQELLKNESATKWNRWHLQALAAEAALFVGDKASAIENASAALVLVPWDRQTHRRYASALMARVFAWAGAENDALVLLETLSDRSPSLGPAEIALDPLYALPLKSNARYQELTKKLEAEIVANRKSL